VPEEARELARHQKMKVIAAAAALFLYADGSRACSTVTPEGVTAAVISERMIDQVSLDRAASVVHATFRRASSASRRGEPLPFTDVDTRAPEARPLGTPPPLAPPFLELPEPAGLATPSNPASVGPARAITQGEFAVLLASTLRLRPPRRGWSAADATTALSTLRLQAGQAGGVVPPRGWRLDSPLTEGDLAFVLAYLGLNVIPREPGRPITQEEAEQVLARLASLFRSLSPAAYSAAPASWNPLSLGNPRAPLSPSTP
jgi:hypothetical protein